MRKNTDSQISGGVAGSSDEAAVMAVERGSGIVPAGNVRQPDSGEERMKSVKPFGIAKRVVWEAYKHIKANQGAAGIDGESIEMFEANLKDNLYRIWNRMSSGSYFPPAVRQVEIPKKTGGVRALGIPTVADRIAQMVVKICIEPALDPTFHPDSYGYRPGKSALQAVAVTRKRCWKYNWVVEFDIRRAFDELDHALLMRAVRKHVREPWAVLYIERWLKAPFITKDGIAVPRDKGTPQGGVISPVLMNLFMHYCFDRWMQTSYSHCLFARYADDAVVHCWSEPQAKSMLRAIEARLAECGLTLHAEKSAVVYCADRARRGQFKRKEFTFLGFTFRSRNARGTNGELFQSFLPAVSKAAMKRMRHTIRSWRLPCQTSVSITELAARYNPILQGWWNYYGSFYKSELHRVYKRFDEALVRWTRRKHRKLSRRIQRSFQWLVRIARKLPQLFFHWRTFGLVGGRAIGAV
jgi:RNA-directed DNA polymerase